MRGPMIWRLMYLHLDPEVEIYPPRRIWKALGSGVKPGNFVTLFSRDIFKDKQNTRLLRRRVNTLDARNASFTGTLQNNIEKLSFRESGICWGEARQCRHDVSLGYYQG